MANKKNDVSKIEKELKSSKCVALVAPSFVVDFKYPSIIKQLKDLGFDQVVELTFGAKMINREYHEILKKSDKMMIASPCPGIVSTIKNNYPKLAKQLVQVDSPLSAMGKICRKHYPKHKLIFIAPCDFKKVEVDGCKDIDLVIDYEQLKELFNKYGIKEKKLRFKSLCFDKFYNDYTKIYPLAGGLAKTAHVRDILKKDEFKEIDGIGELIEFLKNPDPKVKFLDALFCVGGCIGGPHTNKKLSVKKKRKKVIRYMKRARRQSIPENRKGLIRKAAGISFLRKV